MCRQRAEHMPILCAKGTKKLQIDKEKTRKVYKMIVCDISESGENWTKRAAEDMQTTSRPRTEQEHNKSRARPAREKTTRGRGSSQRRTTAPRAGGELADDTTTQQSTPQAHPEWRHGGCQPPSPARAEGGGGTRGATRRGTPRTGGGPADPKGGGGPPPPARGAADAGQRGARHRPRAWQRARGAGGHPPSKGAENPAVYTSV